MSSSHKQKDELMLTLKISEADLEIVKVNRIAHPILLARVRLEAIYQTYLGNSRSAIAEDLAICRNSVTTYIKMVNSDGVESLMRFKYKGAKSILSGHRVTISEYFKTHPPKSAKEAVNRIFTITGTQLSESEARRFMKSLGMRPIKTGHIPGKVNIQKQEEFKVQTLEPLVEKAQNGECHLFFMDASHFVLQAFVGVLWCFTRMFIRSGSGRNRINVLGALDLKSNKIETVINTTYIDATVIVEMLELLASKYKTLPIYIVLDNARYQHCDFVKAAANRLNIKLIFLPPYSPNLNLIERVWKYVKKEYLRNQYFEDAATFHNAIRNAMTNLNEDKSIQIELKTLLNPKFQSFAQNLMA